MFLEVQNAKSVYREQLMDKSNATVYGIGINQPWVYKSYWATFNF